MSESWAGETKCGGGRKRDTGPCSVGLILNYPEEWERFCSDDANWGLSVEDGLRKGVKMNLARGG